MLLHSDCKTKGENNKALFLHSTGAVLVYSVEDIDLRGAFARLLRTSVPALLSALKHWRLAAVQ